MIQGSVKKRIHSNYRKYLQRAMSGQEIPALRSRYNCRSQSSVVNRVVVPHF